MIRNAFLKRVESALETLDEDIDRLAAKAEKAGQDARIRYDEEIAVLRMKRESVGVEVQRLRNAGGASWGPLKSGVLEGTDDLKKAIGRAVERLKKSA